MTTKSDAATLAKLWLAEQAAADKNSIAKRIKDDCLSEIAEDMAAAIAVDADHGTKTKWILGYAEKNTHKFKPIVYRGDTDLSKLTSLQLHTYADTGKIPPPKTPRPGSVKPAPKTPRPGSVKKDPKPK